MTDQRIAILDLGTNTVILLIAEIHSDQSFTVLCDEARVVRLGEGIHQEAKFLEPAMQRTLATLTDFQNIIQKFSCDNVMAVGTAGFRRASNAEEFIRRVHDALGIQIQVISGETEADLIFLATKADFENEPKPLLVLDIGGGSTEFIWQTAHQNPQARSLNFGSVKLTENFLHSDPPTRSECESLKTYVQDQLQTLPFSGQPQTLVATAGTATTLSALSQNLSSYDPVRVHGSRISVENLRSLTQKLEKLSCSERAALPCLEPKRADVIVAGAQILLLVCAHFGVNSILVSDRGLRYGVLQQILMQKTL